MQLNVGPLGQTVPAVSQIPILFIASSQLGDDPKVVGWEQQ